MIRVLLLINMRGEYHPTDKYNTDKFNKVNVREDTNKKSEKMVE